MSMYTTIRRKIIGFLIVLLIGVSVLFMPGAGAAYVIPPDRVGGYFPRADQMNRPVYLRGTFNQMPGAGIVGYDAAGKRQVVSLTGMNWDEIPMDCISSSWGYFKITLALPRGSYEFKMEQKNSRSSANSDSPQTDYWYGLDGYMYSQWDWGGEYPWPGVDIYNNGPYDYNNIHIDLAYDDDVTFYFVDGSRAEFLEYSPASPWYAQDNWKLNTEPGGGRERTAKLHYISAYPEDVRNRVGTPNGYSIDENGRKGLYDHFEWHNGKQVNGVTISGIVSNRFRPFLTPFWFGITEPMQSGIINRLSGTAVNIRADMFLFRRTDVNDPGGIGDRWDKVYYKKHTQSYYRVDHSPYITIINPNGCNAADANVISGVRKNDGLRLDLQINNGNDGLGMWDNALENNNMIFRNDSEIKVAGVYTYYMDGVTFGKDNGTFVEPVVNGAYDFMQGAKNRYQAVYLPTVTVEPLPSTIYDNTPISLKGASCGYNITGDADNVIRGKLYGTLQTPYSEIDMTEIAALQSAVAAKGAGNSLALTQNGTAAELMLAFTTTASAADGAWDWGHTTLPKSNAGYALEVYLEVRSTALLDTTSRDYASLVAGFLDGLGEANYSGAANASVRIYSDEAATYARSEIVSIPLQVANRSPSITSGVVNDYKTIHAGAVKTINEPAFAIIGMDGDTHTGDKDRASHFAVRPGTYDGVTVGALSFGKYPVSVGADHIGNIIVTDQNDGTAEMKLERVYRPSGGVNSVPQFSVPITAHDNYGGEAESYAMFTLANRAPFANNKSYNLTDGDFYNGNSNDVNPRDENDIGDTAATAFTVGTDEPVQIIARAGYYPGAISAAMMSHFVIHNPATGAFGVPSNIWLHNGAGWEHKDAGWFKNTMTDADKANTIVFDKININVIVTDNDAFDPLSVTAAISLIYNAESNGVGGGHTEPGIAADVNPTSVPPAVTEPAGPANTPDPTEPSGPSEAETGESGETPVNEVVKEPSETSEANATEPPAMTDVVILPQGIALFETLPDNATPLANGWFAVNLGDALWEIFDEDGIPLGVVFLQGGESIEEYDVASGLIPLGRVKPYDEFLHVNDNKVNPKTGDRLCNTVGLLMLAATGVVALAKNHLFEVASRKNTRRR